MAFSSLTWRIKEREDQLILVFTGFFSLSLLMERLGNFFIKLLDLICQPFINYVYLLSTDLTFFSLVTC